MPQPPAANAPVIKPPTMQDIATAAGVSKATVSLALRGDARIPAATRQRIELVATQAGYQPDPMLAALSARRGQQRATANLAILIDARWGKAAERPRWMKNALLGISTSAEQLGYASCEFRLQTDLAAHRNPDRVLASRGIRGLILLPFYGERPELPAIDWSLYSVVTMGNLMPEMGWHRVGTDAFIAMNLVCEKLREHGFRRIGLAQYLDTECRLRYEWLGSLLKELHLHPDLLQNVPPLLYARPDPAAFIDWYRSERPEVIVSNNEQVLDWLEQAGIRVPQDVSVTLLNRDSARRTDVAGITQHLADAGSATMELLHGLILRGQKGSPKVRREVLIIPDWESGATLRPLRTTRRAAA